MHTEYRFLIAITFLPFLIPGNPNPPSLRVPVPRDYDYNHIAYQDADYMGFEDYAETGITILLENYLNL